MPLVKSPIPKLQPHQQGETLVPDGDPPPSYTDATAHLPPNDAPAQSTATELAAGSPIASAGRSPPRPPSNAQKVEAPLNIVQSHTAITGDYLIYNGPSVELPDVVLQTTHGKISTDLWIEGSWGRPFAVKATTKHAPVDISLVRIGKTESR